MWKELGMEKNQEENVEKLYQNKKELWGELRLNQPDRDQEIQIKKENLRVFQEDQAP